MANGILVDTGGNPWKIYYGSNGASAPVTLCAYDLIPKRVRLVAPSAAQGNYWELKDGQGRIVYYEGPATGADFDPVEQRPRAHEVWSGPISIANFDQGSGGDAIMLIYL